MNIHKGESKSGLCYSDFKIGEHIMLKEELPLDNGSVVGDLYEITDLDIYFPNAVCIHIINKKEKVDRHEFWHIDYFESRVVSRKKLIDKLLE